MLVTRAVDRLRLRASMIYQSDRVDRADGSLARCANHALRNAIMIIADNLVVCVSVRHGKPRRTPSITCSAPGWFFRGLSSPSLYGTEAGPNSSTGPAGITRK